MSKLLFATGCNKYDAPSFERMVKNELLPNQNLCITFLHESQPYEIAQRAKSKKANIIIFAKDFQEERIPLTVKKITNRMNGAIFFHMIDGIQIPKITFAKDLSVVKEIII